MPARSPFKGSSHDALRCLQALRLHWPLRGCLFAAAVACNDRPRRSKGGGQKTPEEKKLLPPTQYKDFVFLASQRPVLIRLHVQIEGKSHYERFFDFFKEFFAQLDRDKDGVLSTEEIKIVPQAQILQRQLQGQFFLGTSKAAKRWR